MGTLDCRGRVVGALDCRERVVGALDCRERVVGALDCRGRVVGTLDCRCTGLQGRLSQFFLAELAGSWQDRNLVGLEVAGLEPGTWNLEPGTWNRTGTWNLVATSVKVP